MKTNADNKLVSKADYEKSVQSRRSETLRLLSEAHGKLLEGRAENDDSS